MMAFYGYKGDAGECHWTPYGTSTCEYDYDIIPPQASVPYSSYKFEKPELIQHSSYKGDAGECYWTPYSTSAYGYGNDVVPPQASVAYSSHEFEEPKLIEHSSYKYFDSSTTQQVPNYFVHNYSEPRVIQYEPPTYASAQFYSQTNYKISHSTIEFNEPEFEEYDPTPYGGGYDPAQTYGKPLPPSDEICYPRSTPQTNAQLQDDFSYGSIPSPYGDSNDHSVKPHKGNESGAVDNKEQESHGDNGDRVINGGGNAVDIDLQKAIEEKSSDLDEHPSSDYNDGFGNGGARGYGYDWNKQVPYTPYGSGLEAMDLCESIFGYWPCLAKINQQRNANCEVCNEESKSEPWKSTADYIFGSPFVCGEQNDGGNGYYFYGNESYYQYLPQHRYQ